MQTAQAVSPSVFSPSFKTHQVLAHMAKNLPKDPVRNYAGWIGIREGMACMTCGFAMLVHHSSDYQGLELTLDRTLFPREGVTFPQFQSIMPKVGRPVDAEALVDFGGLSHKGKSLGKRLYIAVEGDKVTLVRELKKRDGVLYFNPAILGGYLKSIPKGYSVTGAFLAKSPADTEWDMLRIEFSEDGKEDVPGFTLVLASVRPND